MKVKQLSILGNRMRTMPTAVKLAKLAIQPTRTKGGTVPTWGCSTLVCLGGSLTCRTKVMIARMPMRVKATAANVLRPISPPVMKGPTVIPTLKAMLNLPKSSRSSCPSAPSPAQAPRTGQNMAAVTPASMKER
jgi:hypothetical protein